MGPSTEETVSILVDALRREMKAQSVPGVSIGFCSLDRILWADGFGVTDMRNPEALSVDTLFSVQSTSKTYTATAVLIAVAQGLVDLDEPTTRYLPGFSVRSPFEVQPEEKITIRHLLHHTAGFTHEAPVGSNYDTKRFEFHQHIASISDTYLRFPVCHHNEYSNLGIDLAGDIIETVSGVSFETFVKEHLFDSLDLKRATFDFDRYIRMPAAQSDTLEPQRELARPYREESRWFPPTTIFVGFDGQARSGHGSWNGRPDWSRK